MKRTIYLAVITLITIGCVLYGVFRFSNGAGFLALGNAKYSTEESANLEAFNRIAIDAQVMDLIVKEGTDYSLDYHATENLTMAYQVNNGKLVVSQKKKGSMIGNNSAVLTLTVPADTQFERVDVEIDVGDVELKKVKADYIEADVDVGDITINNAVLEQGVMESDTGDIRLKDSSFVKLDISSDVGDIDVDSSIDISGYSYDLKTDVGDVEVYTSDYGKKYVKDGKNGKVYIRADVGDISVGE